MTEVAKEEFKFEKLKRCYGENPASPSYRLIARLAERFVSPQSTIDLLAGKKIQVNGPQRKNYGKVVVGRVIGVEGRDITYRPEAIHTYFNSGTETVAKPTNPRLSRVKGYFATDDPWGSGK